MLQDAAISRCVKMLGLDRCLQNVGSTVAVLKAGTGCGLFEIELWTGHVYGRLGLVHSPSDFKYDVQDRLIILKWVNWYIQDRREILQGFGGLLLLVHHARHCARRQSVENAIADLNTSIYFFKIGA